MEEAAKSYARRILALHLLLLGLVVAAVVLAAFQVYERTRERVIDEAKQRQQLLAWQTARGIESYYQSILADLDLIRRGDEDEPSSSTPRPPRASRTPLVLAPLLWKQLAGRVSNIFTVLRPSDRVLASFPREQLQEAQQLVDQVRPWLQKIPPDRQAPLISPFSQAGQDWGHLIGVPMPAATAEEGKVVLIAVVLTRPMESRFLDQVNRERSVAATLLDDTGAAMAASERNLIGRNLLRDADPALRDLVAQHIQNNGLAKSIVIDDHLRVGRRNLPPRLLTAEPVAVGGKVWMLLFSARLAEVDSIVAGVFHQALFWAMLVILATTAIFVSTATQMIRARMKVERIRHDLIDKELKRARQIQLAWLPRPRTRPGPIDVAALNEPAGHISGDFYDWFDLPDGRTVVSIGDVTGHGMPAAFLMATAQLLIRTTIQRLGDPGQCLQEVNRHLCCQGFSGQFVTVLLLAIDPIHGILQAATAGHFPPLLLAGPEPRALEMQAGLVLGVQEHEPYQTERFELPQRFGLLLYTDGLIDARSPGGQRFGHFRLHQALGGAPGSAKGLLEAVAGAVRAFVGTLEPADDLTLVAIEGQTLRKEHPHSPAYLALQAP